MKHTGATTSPNAAFDAGGNTFGGRDAPEAIEW